MHHEITIPELTEVVARVAGLLGPREGAVAVLEGGITNRNFRVRLGGTDYVVRLPGKDTDLLRIDREAERLANKAAADLGIAPRVAAAIEEPACLITCFVKGRLLTSPELAEQDVLAEVARGLRSFHDSGLELPARFDNVGIVEHYAATAASRGVDPPEILEDALRPVRALRDAVAGQVEHLPVPCHDDLLSANFLHDGEQVLIVDWEYAGMGDRYFDLGNFAANNELSASGEDRLLSQYFGEPTTDLRRATLSLFRYASDLREGTWGLVQAAVSNVEFDFRAYAASHFERVASALADPGLAERLDQVRAARV